MKANEFRMTSIRHSSCSTATPLYSVLLVRFHSSSAFIRRVAALVPLFSVPLSRPAFPFRTIHSTTSFFALLPFLWQGLSSLPFSSAYSLPQLFPFISPLTTLHFSRDRSPTLHLRPRLPAAISVPTTQPMHPRATYEMQ